MNKMYLGSTLLLAASLLPWCTSCEPPVWREEVKSFIDDGLSIVKVRQLNVVVDGAIQTVVPSGRAVAVEVSLINPQSIDVVPRVTWDNDAYFEASPVITVLSPSELSIAFTASCAAERQSLAFTLGLEAPELGHTFAPKNFSVHCNTPPGCVNSSLDTAMDGSGHVFAAFRLPSAATDDDVASAEITWRRADGTGSASTVTLAQDAPSLRGEILSINGIDILGSHDPLDRYFLPSATDFGCDYLFTVVLIDSEGLRSPPAVTASGSTRIDGDLTIVQPPDYKVRINGSAALHYGSAATFNAGYTDSGSSAVSYEWYLDNLETLSGTGASLTFTPTAALHTFGGHVLLLVVKDSNGFSYAGSLMINVGN